MRSRAVAVTAASTAAALALAACGGGGGGGGGGQEGGGGEELVIWHMETPPNRVEAFNALAEKYNATDPELPVSFQVQEWDQVYSKIAAAAQSGDQPDILFAIPDFATYVREIGLGQPVTDVVERIDGEHGLVENATDPYHDEDYWAVPLFGMIQMLWYRGDMFREAGLEAPRTWDELRNAAETLTTEGRSGIALPAGKNLATDQVIYSLMITSGAANIFTEDEQVDFDKPETVAAFELYDELLQYSPPDSGNYAWGEPQAAFNSGAAAMAIEKGQYLSPWQEESGRPPEDLGCAPIPTPASGGQPGSIYYSNAAMILSDDQARADGAGAFLEWLVDPASYGDFLNAEPGLFLPVTEDGADESNWRQHEIISTYQTCVDAMLEQSQTGELFGFVDGQYVERVGDISGQNLLAQGIQQMYVNDMSPQDAVTWTHEQMQAAIE
ncbi:ABC transporter substrate-binding protein [Georgenia sp. AZ-5]|uniref:ABC transporter substrate-binding protein n=1 Tax=Georgenia sp. AZ-5 TaxID=3367526 RepID=UPI0037547FD0